MATKFAHIITSNPMSMFLLLLLLLLLFQSPLFPLYKYNY